MDKSYRLPKIITKALILAIIALTIVIGLITISSSNPCQQEVDRLFLENAHLKRENLQLELVITGLSEPKKEIEKPI